MLWSQMKESVLQSTLPFVVSSHVYKYHHAISCLTQVNHKGPFKPWKSRFPFALWNTLGNRIRVNYLHTFRVLGRQLRSIRRVSIRQWSSSESTLASVGFATLVHIDGNQACSPGQSMLPEYKQWPSYPWHAHVYQSHHDAEASTAQHSCSHPCSKSTFQVIYHSAVL